MQTVSYITDKDDKLTPQIVHWMSKTFQENEPSAVVIQSWQTLHQSLWPQLRSIRKRSQRWGHHRKYLDVDTFEVKITHDYQCKLLDGTPSRWFQTQSGSESTSIDMFKVCQKRNPDIQTSGSGEKTGEAVIFRVSNVQSQRGTKPLYPHWFKASWYR